MPLKALPHFICPLLSHQTPVYIQTCSNTYHVFVGALLTPRVPSAILPSFVYHSERCLKVYAAAFRPCPPLPPAPTRCLPPETMKLLSPTSVIFQVVHSNLLIESGRRATYYSLCTHSSGTPPVLFIALPAQSIC